MPLFGYGHSHKPKGKTNRQRSKTSLFHRSIHEEKKTTKKTKNLVLTSSDTFTGDSAFDKAVARRLFGVEVVVEHASGPKKVNQMSANNMKSTYRLYIDKKSWGKLTAAEKREIARIDRQIDMRYSRADKKRLSEARSGRLPKHRSIDKHFHSNIKDNEFTPDVEKIRSSAKDEESKKRIANVIRSKHDGVKFERKEGDLRWLIDAIRSDMDSM